MERGFNAGQTHSSIYPSIFNRLRAIARYWSEITTFSYPLHLTPPLRCSHWNSGKKFGPQKTRIMVLPGSEVKKVWRYRLSRFDTIPACDGQTDGRTGRRPAISITCSVWLTHVKNEWSQSVQTWYREWSRNDMVFGLKGQSSRSQDQ